MKNKQGQTQGELWREPQPDRGQDNAGEVTHRAPAWAGAFQVESAFVPSAAKGILAGAVILCSAGCGAALPQDSQHCEFL